MGVIKRYNMGVINGLMGVIHILMGIIWILMNGLHAFLNVHINIHRQ